jgi:hypothetical protein
LVSLPANLRALAREEGGSPVTFLEPLRPWLMRFVPVVSVIAALTLVWRPAGFWRFAPFALAVSVTYAVVMLPVMTTPPLGPMLTARVRPWLSRLPLARHLTKPADALAR